MDIDSTKLTVFFEAPFWIGVFERIERRKLSVCKVVFGAEPKDYEVWEYLLKNYSRLRFSPSVETVVKKESVNPKRLQRQIRKETAATGIGTKSQQALQMQRECGQRGCLETVASGGAVAKLWPSANPPMPDLIRKARQGDGHANDVLTMVAHAMGDTIQIVAQAYDPQRIIIGGGMAKTGDALIEVIQAELSRRAEGCRFLTTLDIASNIRIAAMDQPIGAIGAALAAKRAQPQS